MKRIIFGAALFSGVAGMLAAAPAEPPSFDEMKAHIRSDHPRLFLTRETIPAFRERANTACKFYLDQLRAQVDALPDDPVLQVKPDVADFDGEKVVFKRRISDQNATSYAFEHTGGREAAMCAVLYYATGDRKYVEKGYRYLMMELAFVQISMRSQVLPEWHHAGRVSAFVAYDWLWNELTPDQRRAFIVPMLEHIEFMRKPGYKHNTGGAASGNYGEKGLWWYAGLAAYRDGYADARAEAFLKDGWDLCCRMMDYRDKHSAGTGLLTSICTGYCFGWYPWATHNFLSTLRSATGIDGTPLWTQPRDYARYFNWMMIPNREVPEGFLDFGWGDANHQVNKLASALMYTHLAYGIHLYGENETSRALMALMPEHLQLILGRNDFPWTPFVLTGFDPAKTFEGDPAAALNRETAAFFPAYGLMNMRSGVGPNDTYASIKAGARERGHQHYDELSFVIYKQGFQALDSGTRGSAPHHMAYYPQTVAHNSLLIRAEGEPLPPHWYPQNAPRVDWSKVFNDGGQDQQARGRSLGAEASSYHAVTAGDATMCYAPGKCREAVRQFVYIKPDYFVIYDRLTSVEPDQQKVFLLHTQNEPRCEGGVWRGDAGTGSLFLKTILPADAKTEVVGGPGREFWTNGRNYPLSEDKMAQIRDLGGLEKTWLGRWRLEVSPAAPGVKTRFLTVLQAADGKVPAMVPVENISSGDFDGVRFTTREGVTAAVTFRRDGLAAGHIRLEKDGEVLLDRPLLEPAPVGASCEDAFAKLRFEPIKLDIEPRPDWWRVRPREIVDLCRSVRRGRMEVIAETPAGFPVCAVFYGDFSEPPPQTNWSAGSSSSTYTSYCSRKAGDPQTFLFLAGVHGAEAESVCAAVNLIQMLETGKDFRGKSDPELLDLIGKYRFIIVPCVNMDGRAISPDHLRKIGYEDFRRASQGTWADGSLIGWRGSKEYFPLPLDRVAYPGGYPNAAGLNIMHDACPGHIRTAEARGLLRLCERWRVDAALNGHSCEHEPNMIVPSLLNYPAHAERGAELATRIQQAFHEAGLRKKPQTTPLQANSVSFNLNTMMTLASGAYTQTLECSVWSGFDFEQLIEPNFIALKILLADGLRKPFCDRGEMLRR